MFTWVNERSKHDGAWYCVIFVQTWSAAARRMLSALGLINSILDAMVVDGLEPERSEEAMLSNENVTLTRHAET